MRSATTILLISFLLKAYENISVEENCDALQNSDFVFTFTYFCSSMCVIQKYIAVYIFLGGNEDRSSKGLG